MFILKKRKAFIYEGERAEQYKRMRNKWIRLAVAGTGLPFIFPMIIGFYNESLVFLSLFENGEMILALFSLNFPLLFDLFEIKRKDDENMSWAFWVCAIVVIFQLVIYCSIRINSSEENQIKNIIVSAIMLIVSWITCYISIRAMFQHSIEEERSNNDGYR